MVNVSGATTAPQSTVVINFNQNPKSSYLGSLFNGVTSIVRLPFDITAWTVQKSASAIGATASKSAEIAEKVVNAAIEPAVHATVFAAKVTTAGTVGAASYLLATRPEDTYTFISNLKENTSKSIQTTGLKAYTYFSREPKYFGLSSTESPFETDLKKFKDETIPDLKMKFGYLGDLALEAGSSAYKMTASGAKTAINYFTGPNTYFDATKQKANYYWESGKNATIAASDELSRQLSDLRTSAGQTYSSTKTAAIDIKESIQVYSKLAYEEVSCRSEDLSTFAKETYASTLEGGTSFVNAAKTKAAEIINQGGQLLNTTQSTLSDLYVQSTIKVTQFGADALVKGQQAYTAVTNAPSDLASYASAKLSEKYDAATSFVKTKASDGYNAVSSKTSTLIEAASNTLNSGKDAALETVIGFKQTLTQLRDAVYSQVSNATELVSETAKGAIQSTGGYFGSQTGYTILDHQITKGDVALVSLALATATAASFIGYKYLSPAFENRAEDTKKVEA